MYDTPAIVNCVSKVLLGGNYNFMFSKISKAQLRHKYLMFMINRKCKKRCNGSKRLRVICFWSKSITAVTKGAVTYKFFLQKSAFITLGQIFYDRTLYRGTIGEGL